MLYRSRGVVVEEAALGAGKLLTVIFIHLVTVVCCHMMCVRLVCSLLKLKGGCKVMSIGCLGSSVCPSLD